MNSTKHIDEVFKNKLGDFQQIPPKNVWDKISVGIASDVYKPKRSAVESFFNGKLFRYSLFSGAGLIIIALLIGYYTNSSNKSTVQNEIENPIDEKISNPVQSIIKNDEISNLESSDNKSGKKETLMKEEKAIDDKKQEIKPDNAKFSEIKTNDIPENTESFKTSYKNVFLSEDDEKNSLAMYNIIPELKPELNKTPIIIKEPTSTKKENNEALAPKPVKEIELIKVKENNEQVVQQNNPKQDPPKTEEIIDEANPPSPVEPLLPVDRTESPWSIGGYLTRDFLFNSGYSKTEIKKNYSFDINTSYQKKNYIFQTGLGFDFSQDNWDYIIKYKKNEALGTYDNVDSVYFTTTLDSLGNVVVVPHFITSTETVYDSINHSLGDQSNNHYYYLHIPLIVGYKINDFKHWRVMVKGGAMYSVLIYKKEPSISYYDEGIRVTSIDENKLIRVKTNWHLLIGFEFEYMISDKLSLSVEPVMKYYVKSIYNNNNLTSKQPYSAGIKAGLIYNFR